MDVKLKSLKVVDLKEILQKANVAIPTKANKQDLIAKIVASPAAIDVYNKLHNPTAADDLLAPPEDFDWEADESALPEAPPSKSLVGDPVRAAKPPSKATIKPASEAVPTPADTTPTTAGAATNNTPVDEELEKRKKRAQRFGIPLVDDTKPHQRAPRIEKSMDSEDKLKARAARFGTGNPSQLPSMKRAVEETVDSQEAGKREKRAKRFGTGVAA